MEERKITKLKHIQNITYPEVRRMVEATKYAEVTKKYPNHQKNKIIMCETRATTKPKVIAQLVNEMKALIQEVKTIIEAVTEKLSKDPNTKVATSQERQAKPDRKSSRALTSKVTSIAGLLQTPPKRKTKGGPPPLDGQGHGTKQEKKIDPAQDKKLPQERTDLERKASICLTGKIKMNTKMKNQEAYSKCPQEQSPI